MNTNPISGSAYLRRLLEDHDLNGLMAALRSPASPDLRAQAAQALAELQDLDAVESLVRSTQEDPSPTVRAAARRALEEMLGSQAELAIRSYPAGTPEDEPWLVEPEGEGAPEEDANPEGIDLEGLIRVATHESSPALRLAAIRLLARSSDLRATDMLAYLALRGDSQDLRDAAEKAMEERFGEEAAGILEGYRQTLPGEDSEDEGLWEDEEDEQDEENNEPWVGEDSAEDEEEEVDAEEGAPEAPDRRPSFAPHPGDFPRVPPANSTSRGGVVEEMGIPWGTILIIGLVILAVLAVLFLTGIL